MKAFCEEEQPLSKDHILYGPIYMNAQNSKSVETERRLVVA